MYIPSMFFGLEGDFIATGGTINTFVSGGVLYKSHTFTTTGTFTVTNGNSNNVQIMAIGGGGGAADTIAPGDNSLTRWYGAGGGSGQMIVSQSLSMQKGSYSVTLGSGGTTPVSSSGTDGTNTTITGSTIDITAYGGGGGGYKNLDGNDGGSGGGAGPSSTNKNPGSAIYGNYGNGGGQETVTNPPSYPSTNYYQGGGGGGTGGAGSNRVGGIAKQVPLRYGTNEPYGFGGTNGLKGIDTYPTNYIDGLRGQGGNTFYGDARSGTSVILYPTGTPVSASCYEYTIGGLFGVVDTLVYTDCSDTVVQLNTIGSSSVNICRKADTDIFASSSEGFIPLPLTTTVTYLSPCPYTAHNIYLGNDSGSACTNTTQSVIYSAASDTILNTGSVVYYDEDLNSPLTQSYFSNTESGVDKDWYFISGSDGVITEIGLCNPPTDDVVSGSVINVVVANTGSFYNTQFVSSSIGTIQNTGVTLEIWGKNPALTQNYDAFLGLWDGSGSPNRDWIEIREDGNNHVLGDIYNQESPSFEDKTSPSSAVANRSNWYHHVITFDTGSGVMKYYRNGSVEGTVSSSLDVSANYHTVHVGQQEDGPVSNMYVGEYRVYTSSLAAGDVLYNFNGTKARYGY